MDRRPEDIWAEMVSIAEGCAVLDKPAGSFGDLLQGFAALDKLGKLAELTLKLDKLTKARFGETFTPWGKR